MDREKRSRLRNVVTQARTLIELNIRAQLRRLGINEDGSVRPLWELRFLSREELKLRGKLLQAIQKEKAGDITPQEAVDRYVRHVGFTFVNRIAALRAMEVRGLIKETVLRRTRYGDRSRRGYEIADKHKEYSSEQLLKVSLLDAFREVSEEIKVLFDTNDEYSLLFPEPRTLRKLIEFFSKDIPEEDWKEDDIIGWIYQYFNGEARAKFRRERRKPRADDIPVINQFYTPHWVVQALVDNTLGRLWLEMKERCPTSDDPSFIPKETLENSSGETVENFCSYLVALKQEPTLRAKKSIREIKVLDPACGSGHFLVYAFDVLYRMYLEAEPQTPKEGIPALILENNLFGIDIDLRAVQLAVLSLYLKAKQYNPNLKVKKMNLICADVRITDGRIQKEFLERFSHDPDLQKIFAKLFDDLNYTYEIGSLLKVRRPFERLLSERRREKGVQSVFLTSGIGQSKLSSKGAYVPQTRLGISKKETEAEVKSIFVPKNFTIEDMLEQLQLFEQKAIEQQEIGSMLFATEAEKSVGLLKLLSQKYDVVLMNPPYGDMPETTKKYLRNHYPKTYRDYYAAFIEQSIDLCLPEGFVGALISRTFLFLKSFQALRSEILWEDAAPQLLLDLGFGVLDEATGRWAAMVCQRLLKRLVTGRNCIFFRLTGIENEKERVVSFEKAISSWRSNIAHPLAYNVSLDDMKQVPGNRYSYWTTSNLRSLYAQYPPLDKDQKRVEAPKIADVRQGLETGDDPHFTRRFWEIPPERIRNGKRWYPYARKIEYDSRFYANINVVVNWANKGEEVKNFRNVQGKLLSRPQNESFYFREGITWSRIASSRHLAFRRLPKGSIFSAGHCGLFVSDSKLLDLMLAWANSSLVSFLIFQMDPLLHTWEVGEVAMIPFHEKILQNESLPLIASEAFNLMHEWDTGDEISTVFIKPWILQVLHGFNRDEHPSTGHPYTKEFKWTNLPSLQKIRNIKGSYEMTLTELAKLCIERENAVLERIKELHGLIDEEVYRTYEISQEECELIEKELGPRGYPLRSMDEDFEERVKEHVMRLMSFYVKKALEAGKDGILSLHDLAKEVRHNIALDFGENQVGRREKEIEETLGCSLEEWLAYEFFDFHIDLCERRPICWHLTSANFAKGHHKRGAFNCFLHYHKIGRHTIPNIRGNYLRNEIDRAQRTVDRLRRGLQRAKDAKDKVRERRLSDEFEEASSVLEELQNFDKALEEVHNFRLRKTKLGKQPRWVDRATAEVRDDGWTPIIDYGVRVNLQPLKEAKLLHKAANKVK